MPKTVKATTFSRKLSSSATASRQTVGASGVTIAQNHRTTSQWRESTVAANAKISKHKALTLYRLKPTDLEGLRFETEKKLLGGEPIDTYLYSERDVERRAWERHGGPKGFDAYLSSLRRRYLNKYGENALWKFKQPSPYGEACVADTFETTEPRPPEQHKATTGAPRPKPLNLKADMAPWLWHAYNKALDRHNARGLELGYLPFSTNAQRERPLVLAMQVAKTYPPRPRDRLPSSASVDALRAVLAQAASPPEEDDYGVHVEGLEYKYIAFPEEIEWYEWSVDYLERVYSALVAVIKEHGQGDEGWRTIRWEVYDKYAESMRKPIEYCMDRNLWEDDAAKWLEGRLTTDGNILDTYLRRCSPSGMIYNSVVPLLSPCGNAKIGAAS